MAEEVREGGVEPCITPPLDLWDLLTTKETVTKSLLTRGYAIVKIKKEQVPIIQSMQKSQQQFFSLSPEQKQDFNAGKHRVSSYGYSAVENLKEYYQVRAGGKDTLLRFPGGDPDFGVVAVHTYCLFDDLGRSCLKSITQELKLDEQRMELLLDPVPPKIYNIEREGDFVWTHFLPDHYISSSNVDVFVYNNLDKFNDKWNSNHPAHVDSGILSLIPCSDIPGLEFLDQKLNAWIAVEELIQKNIRSDESHYEYVVVMVGESLQQESKKRIGAGMHRVRRIPEKNGERYSIVYKMRGRPAITGPRYQQDYEVIDIQRNALEKKEKNQK